MRTLGSHENVICLYDTRITGDTLNIVMEYAENGEFFDFVGTGMRQDIGRYLLENDIIPFLATVYFRQIVAGLMFIHSRNIAHRDLKVCLSSDESGRKPTLCL